MRFGLRGVLLMGWRGVWWLRLLLLLMWGRSAGSFLWWRFRRKRYRPSADHSRGRLCHRKSAGLEACTTKMWMRRICRLESLDHNLGKKDDLRQSSVFIFMSMDSPGRGRADALGKGRSSSPLGGVSAPRARGLATDKNVCPTKYIPHSRTRGRQECLPYRRGVQVSGPARAGLEACTAKDAASLHVQAGKPAPQYLPVTVSRNSPSPQPSPGGRGGKGQSPIPLASPEGRGGRASDGQDGSCAGGE